MMKPLALDLCCGKGGWTIGLLAAGWDVIGVDVDEWEGYPSRQFTMDVRHFTKEVLDMSDIPAGRKVSLVVASPPCQEFSKLSLPFFHKLKKSGFQPDKTIWNACIKIAKELKAPIIIENVRGAAWYMGSASGNMGPYYLWGDVPALTPDRKIVKGFCTARIKINPRTGKKFSGVGVDNRPSGKKQKEWSAKVAMIPYELAHWIGTCFYPRDLK